MGDPPHRGTTWRWAGASLAAAVLVAGCGGQPGGPTAEPPPPFDPDPVTLGMGFEEVRARFGDPGPSPGRDPADRDQVWRYGFSQVIFRDGAVVGWRRAARDRQVAFRIGEPDPGAPPLREGATREELHRVLGTPDALEPSGEGATRYRFGAAVVEVEAGRVARWTDPDGALRVAP